MKEGMGFKSDKGVGREKFISNRKNSIENKSSAFILQKKTASPKENLSPQNQTKISASQTGTPARITKTSVHQGAIAAQKTRTSANRIKGKIAETLAAAYLRRKNYRLLARNYSYRGGELDIVAQAPSGEIVFAEVKSVWKEGHGSPESRVRSQKQFKLWRTACHYLHFFASLDSKSRFDVLTVRAEKGSFLVKHYPGAFEGSRSIPEC